MEAPDAGLTVEAIWISPGHDFRGRHGMERIENGVAKVDEVECVAGKGLAGDRYFGLMEDYKGQATFFSTAILEELGKEFGGVDGSETRRNFLVSGGSLEGLLGKRFSVQGVIFEGSEECKPCYWMDRAVGQGAEEFLKGDCRGGIRARVVTSGTIRTRRSPG